MLTFDADELFRDVSRRKKVSSKAGQINEYLDGTDKSYLFRRSLTFPSCKPLAITNQASLAWEQSTLQEITVGGFSASFFFFFCDLFISLELFLPSPSVFFFFGDGLWASSDDDEEDDEWDDEEAEELLLLLDEELDLLFLCESLSLLFTKFSSWLRLKSISVSSDGRESSKSAPERDILMV